MMNLILAATLACPPVVATYGYQQSYGYAAPVYQTKVAYVATPYVAPTYQQAYQQTYQAPAYNSSLVGDYLRQEQAYAEEAKRSAKFDRLIEILEKQAQAPPQQQFQAPPPQYATPQYPQAPSKSVPQFQSPPLPAPQYPSQPFQGEVPPPPVAPPKARPSFGETSALGTSFGVTSMASVLANRCASCHTGTGEKGGGVKLLEFDGRIADLGAISEEIIDATRSGRMPKGAPRLQPAEMLSLYAGLMGLPQGTRVASSGR